MAVEKFAPQHLVATPTYDTREGGRVREGQGGDERSGSDEKIVRARAHKG